MYSLIRCVLHLNPAQLDAMEDEEFWQTWYDVKYYLEIVKQVKFE